MDSNRNARVHAWQRFWARRTDMLDLSDAGFLQDPADWLEPSGLGVPATLAQLSNYRALALLGEPGMGKSVALEQEASRVECEVGTATSIHVDLRAYSSEPLLYQKVFESPQFVTWRDGKSHLFLHLDSLDEALLRIETIANLLSTEFRQLPADRMSVRITCRTAMWPEAILEPAFQSIWGGDAVETFELAPLRRSDVRLAAEQAGVKPQEFIEELFAANAVPFAIKPLTLNLLLGLYKRDGRLPESLNELYRMGSLRLCEEQSPSRRGSRRLGILVPVQRLRLASRMAAVTMLANHYAFWTGAESDLLSPEDVALSKVAIGSEEGDFQPFNVTAEAVSEVLDTGLFSSRGPFRMGWAHQSYAEFLAALYLTEKCVTPSNILKLLLHPAGGLVPQLSMVAAWAASLNAEVRASLIASEPMALLRGDLANWSNSDLQALTTSLLNAYEQDRGDLIPGIAHAYARLNFPGLPELLRPYLTDKSKDVVVRRAAFRIAEACKLKTLGSLLLQVALDRTEQAPLRALAVAAFRTCGDTGAFGQLLPLAKGDEAADSDHEIKGNALQALWPDHITSMELFAALGPSSDGFFGAYALFLTMVLPETLPIGALPDALRWAKTFVAGVGPQGDYHRKRLADAILVKAWQHFDRRELTDIFIENIFARLRQGGSLLRSSDSRLQQSLQSELKSNVERRRRLLLAMASRQLDQITVFYLMRASLLASADLPSLLSLRAETSSWPGDLNEETLCNMIERIADLYNTDEFDAVYEAATKWEALHKRYRSLFEGVLIDSPDAQRAREQQRLYRELEESGPPLLEPPPRERVLALLDRYESGDLNAWWRLNLELTLTERQTHYGSDFDLFITEMPGWQIAEPSTRQRILDAAEGYLHDAESDIDKWIGTTTIHRTDFAAYRAFVLLKELRPDVYDQLPAAMWKKWAPVLVSVPRETGTAKEEITKELEVRASDLAPNEVAAAVAKALQMQRDMEKQSKQQGKEDSLITFHCLRRLENSWDNAPLKEAVFRELECTDNTPSQLSELLDPLLKENFAPARDYALHVLQESEAKRRPYVIAAASGLVRHCAGVAWPAVWKRIVADPALGQELFLGLARHHSVGPSTLSELTEEQLGDLHVWLETVFPRSDDPEHESGMAHWVGPREMVATVRDDVLRHLVQLGTVAAVQILRRNVGLLPSLAWLPYQLRHAENSMRTKTWAPLSLKEVLRVTEGRGCTLVQSADDLLETLAEALIQYQKDLHGAQTPVQDLWDRQKDKTLRPVTEDGLSDHVVRFLRRTLGENGMIANREVEIGRVPGAPIGSRTDIRIDALRRSDDGTRYDAITAVVETKGCWNTELFSALETQLYNDYLVRLGAPVGVYLVGWFDKAKWDDSDNRKRQTPNDAIEEVQQRLAAQAAALPEGYVVKAIVLDCHAP